MAINKIYFNSFHLVLYPSLWSFILHYLQRSVKKFYKNSFTLRGKRSKIFKSLEKLLSKTLKKYFLCLYSKREMS